MTAAVGARNLFKVDAGVVHALMQARYQNPSAGQFLSEDPVFLGDQRQQVLTDPQSFNAYSYAEGNPITGSDPSGRAILTQAQRAASLAASQAISNLYSAMAQGAQNAAQSTVSSFVSGYRQYASGVNTAINNPTGAYQSIKKGKNSALENVGIGVGAAGFILSLGNGFGAAGDAAQLATRATEINGVLDPIAQSMRTTAVLRTATGDIVAGGGRDLTGAQIESLLPGESAANPMPGAHAEVTAITQALNSGSSPQILGTSRAICASCQAYIQSQGGTLIDPFTAIWK